MSLRTCQGRRRLQGLSGNVKDAGFLIQALFGKVTGLRK